MLGHLKCLCLLYPTFIGSKLFCQTEEDRLLNESNEGSDNCDQESTADINAAELTEADKENAGEKKRRRKKKSDKGEFIVKTGKVPLRSIPLNVGISVLFVCSYFHFTKFRFLM